MTKTFTYKAKVDSLLLVDDTVFKPGHEYNIETNDFKEFFAVDATTPYILPVTYFFSKSAMEEILSSGSVCIIESDKESITELHNQMKEISDCIPSYGEIASNYGILHRVPDGEETISGLDDVEGQAIDNTVMEFGYGENLIDDDLRPFTYQIRIDYNETDDYGVRMIYAVRDYGIYNELVAADFTESQRMAIYKKADELYASAACKKKTVSIEKE